MTPIKDIAEELARIGQREAKVTRKLLRLQQARCLLLSQAACDHGVNIGLPGDVVANVIAPKEEDDGDDTP